MEYIIQGKPGEDCQDESENCDTRKISMRNKAYLKCCSDDVEELFW